MRNVSHRTEPAPLRSVPVIVLSALVGLACHGAPPNPALPPGTITFDGACRPGEEITIAAVGDIMMQDVVQRSASQLVDPTAQGPEGRIVSGFTRLFDSVRPDLDRADLLFGNLETPIAVELGPELVEEPDGRFVAAEVEVGEEVLWDGRAYGTSLYRGIVPRFNAHPLLATALRHAGWGVVSTANNHALDRGVNGIDRTIDALRAARLPFAGTTRHDEVRDADGDGRPDDPAYTCVEVRGVRIAFLAFANLVNGVFGVFGVADTFHQVSRLYDNLLQEDRDRVEAEIARVRRESGADLVIVSVHWGFEYEEIPDPAQRVWAKGIIDAGADIVIGHHPHVLQPMERIKADDGREAIVFYSLGNFIADLWWPGVEASAIVYVGVKRDGPSIFLSGVQYIAVEIVKEARPAVGSVRVGPVAIDRDGGSADTRSRILGVLGPGNLKAPDDPVAYPCRCE